MTDGSGQLQGTAPGRMPVAVLVLALGVFVVGTGEFVLAGLIPLLAHNFGLSLGVAGQVVSVFALTCAVAAPIGTTLTVRWPRRRTLLVGATIYLVGAAATALAPTFGLVLGTQIVAAIGTGLFIPNASVTAASLVPAPLAGRAVATAVTGFTVAVAVGAPGGTAVGAIFGWRATMWLTVALAAVGLAGLAKLIPHQRQDHVLGGLHERLRPVTEPRVLMLLATTLFAFTAIYIPYTYIGAIFAPVTGGDGLRLAYLMVALGVAGALGNGIAGRLIDRIGGSAAVLIGLIGLIVSLVAIAAARGTYAGSLGAIALFGLTAFAITAPQQHRLMSHDPAKAPVLVALNQSVLYLAIGASGLIGALGLDLVVARNLVWLSLVLVVLAITVSLLVSKSLAQVIIAPSISDRDRPIDR